MRFCSMHFSYAHFACFINVAVVCNMSRREMSNVHTSNYEAGESRQVRYRVSYGCLDTLYEQYIVARGFTDPWHPRFEIVETAFDGREVLRGTPRVSRLCSPLRRSIRLILSSLIWLQIPICTYIHAGILFILIIKKKVSTKFSTLVLNPRVKLVLLFRDNWKSLKDKNISVICLSATYLFFFFLSKWI